MITARERDRLLALPSADDTISYTTEVPDNGPPRTWTNSRTGEVTTVPAGIDPGWGGNPGRKRAQTLLTRVTQQLDAAGEADARDAITAIVNSDMPRVVMAMPETVFMPAAVAPPALVEELGASTRIVQVSNSTMRVKVDKHVEVLPQSFALIQQVLDEGQVINEGRGRHRSIFARVAGRLWQTVVKSAAAGRELIVATLHGSKERDVERALRKGATKKE